MRAKQNPFILARITLTHHVKYQFFFYKTLFCKSSSSKTDFVLFPCQAIAFQERDWGISKVFLWTAFCWKSRNFSSCCSSHSLQPHSQKACFMENVCFIRNINTNEKKAWKTQTKKMYEIKHWDIMYSCFSPLFSPCEFMSPRLYFPVCVKTVVLIGHKCSATERNSLLQET